MILNEGYQVTQVAPKPHKFVKKVSLCVWWNTQGVVHHEVLESGETVNRLSAAQASQSRADQEWRRFDKDSTSP